MSKRAESHFDDGELLRYADGEVSAREAKRIEAHLAACWKCRTELAELERTIGACVRYRDSVLRAGLPAPPSRWFDIYRRFAEVETAGAGGSWPARAWRAARRELAQPRHWVTATAVVVIAAVVVDHLRNTPSVRAAELLARAAAWEESRPAAPRRIRIRTQARSVVRVIGGGEAGVVQRAAAPPDEAQLLAGLEPLFRKANYNWEDPLSAASFAAWRNGLTEKQDEVATVRDPRRPEEKRYRICTRTSASELVEATLQLTAADLHPVEGTFQFRGQDRIELAEIDAAVGEALRPPAEAAGPASLPRPKPAAPAPPAPPVEVLEPATPGEELEVLAVLHRLGADLGAPVEVSRRGVQLVVSGVGVAPELARQIEEELSGRPGVEVRFAEPSVSPAPAAQAPEGAAAQSGTDRWRAELERELGGPAEFDAFADEVLRLCDGLMSRAHALRRLAGKFPAAAESELSEEHQRLLWRLRSEHAVALAGLAAALEQRTRPVLLSLGAADPASVSEARPGRWQAGAEELLGEARRTEALLAAMLGGAAAETPAEKLAGEALLRVARLRAAAAVFVRETLK